MRRLLVYGGHRTFMDASVFRVLDQEHLLHPIDILVSGLAQGIDWSGLRWARENGVRIDGFPAHWNKYGNRAGPIRNQRMLDEGNISDALTFPGASGTAHMTKLLTEAEIPIKQGIP